MLMKRLRALKSALRRDEGILVYDPKDIYYLTGLEAEIFLVVSRCKLFLFLPEMLEGQFRQRLPDAEILPLRNFKKDFLIIKKYGVKRIKTDSKRISCHLAGKLKKIRGFRWIFSDKGTLIDKMRQIKDKSELLLIQKACKITAKTFGWISKRIRPGMTEEFVSGLIKRKMLEFGATGTGFEPIVAFGKNSGHPHHVSGQTVIGNRGVLLLDFGCSYKGYNSDLTRVIFLGRIHKLYDKISKIVSLAHKKAVRSIKPGRDIFAIDRIARDVINAHGYKKCFTHSLGHGVGLEVHEPPSVSSSARNKLKTGMVITVEPGIYIPEVGGVRLEDTVLVTGKGAKILTKI